LCRCEQRTHRSQRPHDAWKTDAGKLTETTRGRITLSGKIGHGSSVTKQGARRASVVKTPRRGTVGPR
jgi:hypothetical protein